MGFNIIWEKAITDSAGNIRVPIFLDFGKFKPKDDKQPPLPKTKNVFELYIKNDKEQNEVSIIQFMHLKGKYYPLRLSLDGEVKTKSGFNISMQDIKVLSKKGNETQNHSSSLNKTMITESAFMALIQNMYGSNVEAVVIYECPGGTWFDPTTCFCDYPENVNSASFYPEIFMALFTGFGIYELVPYPFSFHPSEITSDSEYPQEPIDGGGEPGTYDCDGVLNGSAYMADCGCIGGTTGIIECDPNIEPTVSLVRVPYPGSYPPEFGWGSTGIPGGNNPVTNPTIRFTINAKVSNGNWVAVLVQIEGDYFQAVRLYPGVQEVSADQTTQTNYCTKVGNLSTLGAFVNGIPPTYYMLTAVQAHEDVHKSHLLPLLQSFISNAKSLVNSISVPHTGQSKATAIMQIMGLTEFINAQTSTHASWANAYEPTEASDHGTNYNGSAYEAEKLIVKPVGNGYCSTATTQG